jgi:hypothetical protein
MMRQQDILITKQDPGGRQVRGRVAFDDPVGSRSPIHDSSGAAQIWQSKKGTRPIRKPTADLSGAAA